jgi:hypothetical protein
MAGQRFPSVLAANASQSAGDAEIARGFIVVIGSGLMIRAF